MSLLDLPPELFLHITHDVIDTCGISGTWKLREVCKTFADNITHEIMNRPTTGFTSRYRDRSFFNKSISRYLAARLHNELDVDPKLVQKVRDMVAWAVSKLGTTKLQQRDDVAFKVCAALERTIGSSNLAHALGCDASTCFMEWAAWSQQPLDSHDKMLVMVAIECYDNATELLKEFSDSTVPPQWPSERRWLEFVPFDIAFQKSDEVLLNILLQYITDVASQGAEGKETLSRLTSGRGAPFRMHYAVSYAIKYSNYDGLQSLLDFYRKHLSPPERAEYTSWVRDTICDKGSTVALRLLPLLLDFKPRGKSLVDKRIIDLACDRGTAAMIKEVLKHANKNINNGTILTLPIFIAVRSGRTAAINGVIDAGADPKVIADSNMGSVKKDRLTPFEYAMHRNSPSMVEALLQRGGGPIPHISEWTTHQRTYNFFAARCSKSPISLCPS